MLKKMRTRLKNEKGFTLVELLAVIAILAIILAIAVPSVGKVIENSEEKAHKANLELFENAARLAYVSEEVENASGTGSKDDGYTLGFLEEQGYLNEIPDNPQTDTKYNGRVNVSNNGSKFTYSETTN